MYLVNYLPSKQASKQALICIKLKSQPLRNSCFFEKIVIKIGIIDIARGQSDLWSFGPCVSFVPFFIV
jgi:hypothetical protein